MSVDLSPVKKVNKKLSCVGREECRVEEIVGIQNELAFSDFIGCKLEAADISASRGEAGLKGKCVGLVGNGCVSAYVVSALYNVCVKKRIAKPCSHVLKEFVAGAEEALPVIEPVAVAVDLGAAGGGDDLVGEVVVECAAGGNDGRAVFKHGGELLRFLGRECAAENDAVGGVTGEVGDGVAKRGKELVVSLCEGDGADLSVCLALRGGKNVEFLCSAGCKSAV